jgi:simple sugar transport system permease protein
MEDIVAGALFVAIQAGAVIVIAAMGELVGEQSGVFNMGLEGTMAMGAIGSFIAVTLIPNPFVGMGIAMLVGVIMGCVLAIAVVHVRVNQLVAGLALGFVGNGIAREIGRPYAGMLIDARFQAVHLPVLSDLPYVGRALFSHDPAVYLAYLVLPALVSLVLFRTRWGMAIRACGENPAAADSAGISVTRVRFLCTCFAGAMAGAAGAYLVLAFAPTWVEGVTGGKGWIAVALVIFSRWRPKFLILGALLFGIMTSLGFVGQIQGWGAYANFLSMIPYLSTIALLMLPSLSGRGAQRKRAAFPGGLGMPYSREEA